MKRILFITSLFLSVSAIANDTISMPIMDTVVMPMGAVKINPIVINAVGDTAYSFTWKVLNISSDTTDIGNIIINLYGRKATILTTIQNQSSITLIRKFYPSFTFIEAFILSKNKRLIKQ